MAMPTAINPAMNHANTAGLTQESNKIPPPIPQATGNAGILEVEPTAAELSIVDC